MYYPRKLIQPLQHYELPDAAHLTSEDICNALCTNNEWIPALVREDHLQLPTSRGLVVAKDVMDLVDWLVGEGTNESGDFDGMSLTLRLHSQGRFDEAL